MTSKRHLPILVESSVNKVSMLRVSLMGEFERKVRFNFKVSGGAVTCTPGCAWCCHHPVSISILEGITIYRWLVKQGKWSLKLREELKKSAEMQLGLTPEVWLKSLIPCPLLGSDNKCTVYSTRPLICRAYYATSDPHYCHPHRLSKTKTKLLPRKAVVDAFHREQEAILRKHKLQIITLPIGAALLMSEKICTEQIDLDALDGTILKEYGGSV
jgi:Fe-S-cluster containining protein